VDESPAERFHRIGRIFDAALELPPASRAAFIDENAADEPELAAEVRRLLASHERSKDFLAAPALGLFDEGAQLLPGAPPAPEQVGPFRVVRTLGRGGMGVVYLGERDDGQFRQRVALKLIRHGGAPEELVHRFVEERRILALLEHPGIARLVDGGLTVDRLPWFAMEFVDGEPLDAYCDARGLPLSVRLDLLCTVCEIVQYAHQHLVVHRDLKPSNILVTAEGQLKLLDFGIAKLLDPPGGGGTGLETRAGILPMTPEYAAPEQMRGEPVSTATDVYALGVLLYALLTGERPYDLAGLSQAAIQRVVCEVEPPRPSEAVLRGDRAAARAATRSKTPERLRRRLRGDLDLVVMKALHKEPGRRYRSAAALHDDLRRFREGRPVLARPDSLGYRVRRFIGRNPAGTAAAAVAVLALLGATGVSTAQTWEARRQRDAAVLDATRQEAMAEVQRVMSSDSRGADGVVLPPRGRIELAEEVLTRRFGSEPWVVVEVLENLSASLYEMGDREAERSMLARAAALARASDLSTQLAAVDCRRAYSFAYDEQLDSARVHLVEARGALGRADRRVDGRARSVEAACLSAEGQVLVAGGDAAAALPLLLRAVALTEGDPRGLLRLSMLNDLAGVLRAEGRTREASTYQARIVTELAEAGYGNTDIMPNVVLFLASSLFELGELAVVDSIVGGFVAEQEARHGSGRAGSVYGFMYGLGKLRLGQLDSAEVWIGRALSDTTQGAGGLPVWMPAALAQLRLEQGRLPEARRAVAELPENTPTRRATAVWLRARLLHAEGGDAAGASLMLEEGLTALTGAGATPPPFLGLPLITAAEWRLALGDPAAADSLALLGRSASMLDSLAGERSAYVGRAELVRARALAALGDSGAARQAAERAGAALANGYGAASAFTRQAAALRDSLPR